MRRLLLILAVVGTLAARAAARAGGGESYSGSSSGSGSYSYSGGSGGSGDIFSMFLYLYLNMVFRHPLIGIPLTLFLLYITRSFWTQMNTVPVGALTGGVTPDGGQLSPRKAKELAQLSARDPAFDERAFLGRAGAAFLKIQKA